MKGLCKQALNGGRKRGQLRAAGGFYDYRTEFTEEVVCSITSYKFVEYRGRDAAGKASESIYG
jgi:hypothetical protein